MVLIRYHSNGSNQWLYLNWLGAWNIMGYHDDVIKWKHFPRYWPFVRGIPTQRPVTRSFDVYFDLRPNKRLSKQWWGWWFETQSCPLWRHRNVEGWRWGRTDRQIDIDGQLEGPYQNNILLSLGVRIQQTRIVKYDKNNKHIKAYLIKNVYIIVCYRGVL